jgi:hypothetical protein
MTPLRLAAGLAVGFAVALVPAFPAQQPATAAASGPAPAPAAAPATTAPTLSVDARLVNIPVVVRDKKGALIQNLTKDDFILQVDDHPQTIRYFDKDTDLPLTLGLLVDTSLSQRNVLDEERDASSIFLDQMLTTPKDAAFVAQFAREVELLQDLTSSRPRLQAALKELDTTTTSASSNDTDDSSGGHQGHMGGGTALYDALFLASDELMSKQKGRKAIIILSDGVDRNSKENLASSIEAAQRADTIVYAIYFKGEEQHNYDGGHHGGHGGGFPGGGYPGGGYPGGHGGGYPGGGGGGYPGGGGGGGQHRPEENRADGRKTLERMAQETGGRLFEVSKKETVAQIYAEIAEELRAQYRLGYTPDQATASDGYHQIDLALKDKKLTVQTRDGYYTGK